MLPKFKVLTSKSCVLSKVLLEHAFVWPMSDIQSITLLLTAYLSQYIKY